MEPSSRYLTKVEFVDWLSGFSKWLKEFEEGMVTRLEERLAPRFTEIDKKLDGIDKRLRDIEGFHRRRVLGAGAAERNSGCNCGHEECRCTV